MESKITNIKAKARKGSKNKLLGEGSKNGLKRENDEVYIIVFSSDFSSQLIARLLLGHRFTFGERIQWRPYSQFSSSSN